MTPSTAQLCESGRSVIDIEAEELDIARMQPWKGGPAIFAAVIGFTAAAHAIRKYLAARRDGEWLPS